MNDDIKLEPEESYKESTDIRLYSGTDCKLSEISMVMKKKPTKLIILAGPANSGKTTLLATLNDTFQKGPLSDYLFAGSRTLPGFERRSHLSRMVSGNLESTTERTKIVLPSDISFLHIDLYSVSTETIISYLISDISGENFKQMRDSSEECLQYSIIKRADHFSLFFDCKELVDNENRNEAKMNGLLLLRSCVEAGILNGSNFIEIVFSKWDFIANSEDQEKIQHLEFIESIKREINKRFSQKLPNISFINIACRPQSEILNDGYGLNDIVEQWTIRKPLIIQSVPDLFEEKNSRAFLKFNFQ